MSRLIAHWTLEELKGCELLLEANGYWQSAFWWLGKKTETEKRGSPNYRSCVKLCMSPFDKCYWELLVLLKSRWLEKDGATWSGTDMVWPSLFHAGEDPARAETVKSISEVHLPSWVLAYTCFGGQRRNCGEHWSPLFLSALCLRSLQGWINAVGLSLGFECDLCNPWVTGPGASSTAFGEIQRWGSWHGLLCVVVLVIVMHKHGSDEFCTAELLNIYTLTTCGWVFF